MRTTPYLGFVYPDLTDVADGAAWERALAIGMDTAVGGPGTDFKPNLFQGISGSTPTVTSVDYANSYARYKIVGKELYVFVNLLISVTNATGGGCGFSTPVGMSQFSGNFNAMNNFGVGTIQRAAGGSTLAEVAPMNITPNTGGTVNIFGVIEEGTGAVVNDRVLAWVMCEIR
jgi:hypothetical protein